jgi:RNA polymerase sigma-70 factor (ECF subfamily)
LLARAGDWTDFPAWREFFRRYDPLLRRWCRPFFADDSDLCEVTQRIWLELADRMVGFRYDTRRSFRGWLRDLCRCRSIDYLRHRERERRLRVEFDESIPAGWWEDPLDDLDPQSALDDVVPLLAEAESARIGVRNRVSERTWDVYWRIAIEGESIRETASAYSMTYAAAFAAYSRVDRMLREEGCRRLARAAEG